MQTSFAGSIREVSEVIPHIDAEKVADALGQCLLGLMREIIVCSRILVFAGRDADCDLVF